MGRSECCARFCTCADLHTPCAGLCQCAARVLRVGCLPCWRWWHLLMPTQLHGKPCWGIWLGLSDSNPNPNPNPASQLQEANAPGQEAARLCLLPPRMCRRPVPAGGHARCAALCWLPEQPAGRLGHRQLCVPQGHLPCRWPGPTGRELQ